MTITEGVWRKEVILQLVEEQRRWEGVQPTSLLTKKEKEKFIDRMHQRMEITRVCFSSGM